MQVSDHETRADPLIATSATGDFTPAPLLLASLLAAHRQATGRAVQDACRMSYAGLSAPSCGKGIAPTDLCR